MSVLGVKQFQVYSRVCVRGVRILKDTVDDTRVFGTYPRMCGTYPRVCGTYLPGVAPAHPLQHGGAARLQTGPTPALTQGPARTRSTYFRVSGLGLGLPASVTP